MKRGLYWLGGIGVGAGLMYWFDPARGQHRRTHTRAQLLSARYRVGDLMANATPHLPHLHLPRRYRPQFMPPFRRQRQPVGWPIGLNIVLFVLGGLGLSAVLAWMVRSRNDFSLSAQPASAALQAIGEWVCGAWDGVRTWFQPSVGSTNSPTQPYEREHEVTMMGVEAESTKETQRQTY